jgi:hypothetical protein
MDSCECTQGGELASGTKRLLIFGALALGVVVVALAVQNLGAVIVSAVVAAIVAILVHRSLGPGAPVAEAGPASDPADAWIAHLQQLARLNVQIRENGLADEVLEKLEHSIDTLRRLLPELNEDHEGSELTWTVNRMASDYLSRIVTPFVALSPPDREEHRAELLRSLAGLEAELDNIAELLRSAQAGEFKTKAAFLRARFLDADLG